MSSSVESSAFIHLAREMYVLASADFFLAYWCKHSSKSLPATASAKFESAFSTFCNEVLIFIGLGWQDPCSKPADSDCSPEVTRAFEVVPLNKHHELERGMERKKGWEQGFVSFCCWLLLLCWVKPVDIASWISWI